MLAMNRKLLTVAIGAMLLAMAGSRPLMARAGDLDPTFDGDGKVTTDFANNSIEWAAAVAIQRDGKIVAAGTIANGSKSGANRSFAHFALARYKTDGTLGACRNNLECHREEPEGRRGDLRKSSAYVRLLRRYAPRNDKKANSPTGS